MIDSRAQAARKRGKDPLQAPHSYRPWSASLADVLIHAHQSAKRCEMQCRHAAAPSSRERSPWRDHRPRCP
eukprot:354935-Chlamydomonas_euryale.AAC.1